MKKVKKLLSSKRSVSPVLANLSLVLVFEPVPSLFSIGGTRTFQFFR